MSYSKTSSQTWSSYVLLKNVPTDIMSYSKTSSQTLSSYVPLKKTSSQTLLSYVPLKNVLTDMILLCPTQKHPHRHFKEFKHTKWIFSPESFKHRSRILDFNVLSTSLEQSNTSTCFLFRKTNITACFVLNYSTHSLKPKWTSAA